MVKKTKQSVSGSLFFVFWGDTFAMPCDLRKKAALTNFLRDIHCLMFVFVSVVPLFTYIYIYICCPDKTLNSVNCQSFHHTKKTKLTKQRMVCTIVALLFLCSFWQQKKHTTCCVTYSASSPGVYTKMCFKFSHHSQLSGLFDFLSLYVVGT